MLNNTSILYIKSTQNKNQKYKNAHKNTSSYFTLFKFNTKKDENIYQ